MGSYSAAFVAPAFLAHAFLAHAFLAHASLAVVLTPALALAQAGPTGWRYDFAPISQDDWTPERAAHLLERAGFGGTPEEVAELAALPPRQAVRRLVRYQTVERVSLPEFRHSGIFPSDDFVPPQPDDLADLARRAALTGNGLGVPIRFRPGTPWLQPLIDQNFYLRFANVAEATRVASWFAERMLLTNRPLEEKLALFWHGHFATEVDKVRDYRKLLAQWETFRTLGNGRFETLLLAICRDPAMLIYLDGYRNVRGHPNENFARELLELFALGAGNYTEKDIQEAARAFTGWGLHGNEFDKSFLRHDRGRKTFLGERGRLDGDDIVRIALAQPASARFIAAKLYRFFVAQELSAEANEELAAALRAHDFEIAALLETLFLSRDFYSADVYSTQIKSPIQLVVSTYRRLGLSEIPSVPNFTATTQSLGQQLLAPPNVAGWKGGRSWINPSTALGRQNFARFVLFPSELPPPEGGPMRFVAGIIGERPFRQLNQMARRGDYTSSPSMSGEDNGFSRAPGVSTDTYDAFRGVYNGAIKTFQRVRFEPPAPAPVDLVGLLPESRELDAETIVDYFARRLLRVPLRAGDRKDLVRYLESRVGTGALVRERVGLETDLRELVHLIMSLPEYQLG